MSKLMFFVSNRTNEIFSSKGVSPVDIMDSERRGESCVWPGVQGANNILSFMS